MFLCTWTHHSAWLFSRCSGQQGQEEGHSGSEAERPSLCSEQGQVYPGEEQQRRPASGTDRPHLAEQGAVGGHPHTDWHRTHKVKTAIVCACSITFVSFTDKSECAFPEELRRSTLRSLSYLLPEWQSDEKCVKIVLLLFSFFFRRLSQRPTAEELEQRNILQRQYQLFLSFSPCFYLLLNLILPPVNDILRAPWCRLRHLKLQPCPVWFFCPWITLVIVTRFLRTMMTQIYTWKDCVKHGLQFRCLILEAVFTLLFLHIKLGFHTWG